MNFLEPINLENIKNKTLSIIENFQSLSEIIQHQIEINSDSEFK
jgi:hypothetical protein